MDSSTSQQGQSKPTFIIELGTDCIFSLSVRRTYMKLGRQFHQH